jgi:GTPase SAR1 family protein
MAYPATVGRAGGLGNMRLDLHDEIMDRIGEAFTKEGGLGQMCQELQIDVKIPRKKVSVLLLGNYSAGKSSFINWYVGDNIQKTGAAQVTVGFHVITSGETNDHGEASYAIRQLPYLQVVEKNKMFPGFLKNLTMEISPSKKNNFPLVDLIDSPGLTDQEDTRFGDKNTKSGDKIEDILLWLASNADLVFCFLDTHGLATVNRTKKVIRGLLSGDDANKVYLCMTQCDTKTAKERTELLSQLSSQLTADLVQSKQAARAETTKIYTIFIPDKVKESDQAVLASQPEFNQIGELIDAMNQAIFRNVEQHCNKLDATTSQILEEIQKKLQTNEEALAANARNYQMRKTITWISSIVPILLGAYALVFTENLLGASVREYQAVSIFYDIVKSIASVIFFVETFSSKYYIIGYMVIAFLALTFLNYILSLLQRRVQPTATIEKFKLWQKHVQDMRSDKTEDLEKVMKSNKSPDLCLVEQMWKKRTRISRGEAPAEESKSKK